MANDSEPLLCPCEDPKTLHTIFERNWIGDASGSYAEVSVYTCKHCRRQWLHLLLEAEHLTGAGRWYRGLIDEKTAREITPDTAIAVLESLDWCIYGGSWFGHAGTRSSSPVRVTVL